MQTQTALFKILNKFENAFNDEFYVIIESDGENNPRILTDNSGYTLKYRNLDILKGVIKTLNKSELSRYYYEKIIL